MLNIIVVFAVFRWSVDAHIAKVNAFTRVAIVTNRYSLKCKKLMKWTIKTMTLLYNILYTLEF